MSLTKRLVAVEAAIKKQNGDSSYKFIFLGPGESKDEGKARAGLGDYQGVVLFFDELDLEG